MENNGKGIFYGVIGVATLIVAIIGATFAYFSATVTSNGSNITGTTLDVSGTALKLEVTRITFDEASAPSDDLVPANMGTISTSTIQDALDANCENIAGDYTGCHLYQIVAETDNDLSTASINLSLSVSLTNSGTATSDWKYVVFTGSLSGTTSAATGVTVTGIRQNSSSADIAGSFNLSPAVDIHHGALYSPTTTVQGVTSGATYYLLIYLENDASNSQNTGTASEIATGTYTGTVGLQAAGGQISASFTS